MEKPIDKKALEELALLIASKTGLDDNYASVARKVIDDYVGAKKLLAEYNREAAKTGKRLAKQQKKGRADDGNKAKQKEAKAAKKTRGA